MTMLEPGEVFAERYQIVRLLASGGMGAVFEARHLGTERHVALKLLWPHVLAVDSAREKFQLEAKVAARVQSEHIVHVLDAGFDPQTRTPYLAMELLNGGTLAALVERDGPQSPRVTINLLQQVARGLDAAHGLIDERGRPAPIVHRDLKPENLLLSTRPGEASTIKILDFGIAKVASESRNVSHEVRGTPLYMAFEQVVAGPLSGQTDVWALGLIAYYLLTGHGFWRTATDPNAGIQALFAEIVTLPIPPASTRMREQGLKTRLPEEFDAWLARCLDRVPTRRFESAGSAVIALEAALRGASRSSDAPFPATVLDPELDMPGGIVASSLISASSWRAARPMSPGSSGSMLSAPAIESVMTARRGGGASRHRWLAASGLLAGLVLLVSVGALLRWRASAGELARTGLAASAAASDGISGAAKLTTPAAGPARAASPAVAADKLPASAAHPLNASPATTSPEGGMSSATSTSLRAQRPSEVLTVRPHDAPPPREASADPLGGPYWQPPRAAGKGVARASHAHSTSAPNAAAASVKPPDRSPARAPRSAPSASPGNLPAKKIPPQARDTPPPSTTKPTLADSALNPFDMR